MIHSHVYKACLLHAASFVETTGMQVIPSGNTVLSSLVGQSVVGHVPDNEEITYGDVLQAITQDTSDGPSGHTRVIGAVIDKYIPMVSDHIAYVKNTVRPKVVRMEDAARAALSLMENKNPYSLFTVTQTRESSLVDEESLMSLVERFASSDEPVPVVVNNFPAVSKEELIRITSVSSARVNQAIAEWLAEQGDSWLTDVWSTFFSLSNTTSSGKNPAKICQNFSGISSLKSFERFNLGMVLFLLSRGLYDEPLDGAGMTLAEWRNHMDNVSRFCGNQAKIAAKIILNFRQSKVVIMDVSKDRKLVTVYQPVYQEYLQQGGTVEEVLGAAISGSAPVYSLSDLQESVKSFYNIWKNYELVSQSTLSVQTVERMRLEYKSLFLSLFDNSQEETLLLTELGLKKSTMIKEAEAYIDSLNLPGLRNVGEVCLRLVAGIRYSYTPGEKFLRNMIEASKVGCDSPQEAAAYAAYIYMCDFMCTEMALLRV